MDKYGNVMRFLTEYTEDMPMDSATQGELFSMIRDFIETEDTQHVINCFMQSMLEQHRPHLLKHSRT